MKSARFGRLVRGSRKACLVSCSSRLGNWLISSDCCSMVAIMRLNEAIRVPISSLRDTVAGCEGCAVVTRLAVREIALARSQTT
ncbi:MAG: hypothetical protein DMD77_14175 [Candidatus Rokuibacteriota bacterium]|nr:MAG: hypothetical protein DMD77_14175 [Candidatus Rokubacteria bacterium]